jgi:hypothetical protein
MWTKNDCVSFPKHEEKLRKNQKLHSTIMEFKKDLKSLVRPSGWNEYSGYDGLKFWLVPAPPRGYSREDWEKKLKKHDTTFFHVRINILYRYKPPSAGGNYDAHDHAVYEVWFRDEAHIYKHAGHALRKVRKLIKDRSKIVKKSAAHKREICVMGDGYYQCPRCGDFNGAGREYCFDCGKTL